MILSKVISTAVDKGKLIVKVLGLGSKDIKTVYHILPFGIDCNIPEGYRAIYADTGIDGEKVLIGVINERVLTEVGDFKIFATNSQGEEQISIYLRNDGTCEIGGNSDFFVRYTKLEEGFNALKDDFNKLVTAFNQHVHASAAPPTAVPNVIPAVNSTANISEAKIENIKTS